MRRLVGRLQQLARERGAEILSGARVLGFDGKRLATISDEGLVQIWQVFED